MVCGVGRELIPGFFEDRSVTCYDLGHWYAGGHGDEGIDLAGRLMVERKKKKDWRDPKWIFIPLNSTLQIETDKLVMVIKLVANLG